MAQRTITVNSKVPRGPSNVNTSTNKILKTTPHRKKCEEVLDALMTSLKESDLKVISFIAACNKKIVKPFPIHLADESFEGFQILDAINKKILKLEILKYYLENSDRYKVEESIIELLHWLICGLQSKQRLKGMPEALSVYEAVLRLVQQPSSDLAIPSLVFKIKYWAQSWEHLQWEELSLSKTTKFAFLRTEIDQLHSLIHLGAGSFVRAYGSQGSGVLLTSNLSFCLDSTVAAWVWGKNSIGLQMKCVVLVEFIEDDARILRTEDENTFYLVNSAAAVRPRFILLYKRDPPPAVQPPDITWIEERRAYRLFDELLRHLPCIAASMGLTFFLMKETRAWQSWGASRTSVVNLMNQLSM